MVSISAGKVVSPALLNKLQKALGISSLEDWYHVVKSALERELGYKGSLKKYGDLEDFLRAGYPNHQWDSKKFQSSSKLRIGQRHLEKCVRGLFPTYEVVTNARKDVGIISPETGEFLEIDIWIAGLRLGFEYQDKHHYIFTWYANDTLERYKRRDSVKISTNLMSQHGNTLITVPCWWDGSSDSLAASVKKERPELLPTYTFSTNDIRSIPSEPPSNFFQESFVPDVGQLMSASVFNFSVFDPSNWWMGEKYDGIRSVWNPKTEKMYSRFGNELAVIPSILSSLPHSLLDGEIWYGRGDFINASRLSGHSPPESINWAKFKYVIFDCPDAAVGDFEVRYAHILRVITMKHATALVATRCICKDKPLLKHSILKDGGEGVILRKPHSPYEHGRSANLVKIKAHRDSEAQVLEVYVDTCICKLPSGIAFEVSYSPIFDREKNKLKVGDIVSFYHSGFYPSSGKPRQPAIYRIRNELTWQQVINMQSNNVPRAKSIEATKQYGGGKALITSTKQARGYWNHTENHRKFLSSFAHSAGFDPLLPSPWRSVSARDIIRAGGRSLLYHGSPRRAILRAFPEFRDSFSEDGIGKQQKGYWRDINNCRQFFDEFAKKREMDPLIPNNWYSVSQDDIRDAGGGSLVAAFSGFRQAIQQAYPSVEIDPKKFESVKNVQHSSGYWTDPNNCKKFLLGVAIKKGIDVHNAQDWLSLSHREILSHGGKGLLKYYDNSHIQAIAEIFPELNLDLSRLRRKWKSSV